MRPGGGDAVGGCEECVCMEDTNVWWRIRGLLLGRMAMCRVVCERL